MGNGNGNGGDIEPLIWVLGGTAATIAAYHILKAAKPADQVAPVPNKEAPSAFVDMNAVAVRFGQVRELWTMGYLNPEETVDQLTGLLTAITELQKAGKASAASAQELSSRISGLIDDVVKYQQLQASPA
jgi:hypothetical protein